MPALQGFLYLKQKLEKALRGEAELFKPLQWDTVRLPCTGPVRNSEGRRGEQQRSQPHGGIQRKECLRDVEGTKQASQRSYLNGALKGG